MSCSGIIFLWEDRSNHVFTHPFGIFFSLSPYFGVHIESRMTPVKNLLDKIRIDQLFFKEKREDFKCEKSTEQGIIEWRDFVELSFFICPSLCDQKVEVRMKVYPASE